VTTPENNLPAAAIDLETHCIAPGLLAPPPVCGSFANDATTTLGDGGDLVGKDDLALVVDLAKHSELVIGANIASDFGVLAAHGLMSIEDIFRVYDEDRVYDVLLGQALDAIASGTLFKDPRTGGPLRDPGTNKVMQRYSLAVCADLTLGLATAKANDQYRTRYAVLERLPMSEWPEEAVQYPKDDARNTFEIALAQLGHLERGEGSIRPGKEPFWNLHDMPRQVRAAWALHLASMWGFRTDPARVAALESKIEKEHAEAVASFVPVGFIREKDGSEDTAAVKRAIAKAYGATGTCKVCNGTGKIKAKSGRSVVNCKIGTATCGECGLMLIGPDDNLRCANGHPGVEVMAGGCDGTGLDLSTAPGLPRTEKGAVSASRDTLMESGDDLLERYAGVSETEKLRDTYLPFLKSGTRFPINVRSNTIVETGRTSYDGLIQTIPRSGGVRETIVPRKGSVFCSIDYSAIELCTLAQANLTLVGHSRMADLINESGDPGSLHTAFAATMIGADVEDLKKRVKAKDPAAVGFRQAAKAANFGFGGGMGASTLVLAKRKRIEGVTPSPDGQVEYAGIRFCLLIGGADRCGTDKTTEWKGKTIPPTCTRCLECAEDLRAQWFKQWPEMQDYFKLIGAQVDNDGSITQIASARVRGGVTFTSAANGYFQALAADGAKAALYAVSRECYVDRDSPMYGARPIFFNHDEIFSEIPLAIASPAAKRMAEVMVETMRSSVLPDVCCAAEPALMWRWSKSAATIYDAEGNLVPDPETW
jgi:hypothetical protein